MRSRRPCQCQSLMAVSRSCSLDAERSCDFVDGERRRQFSIRDRLFDRWQARLELGIGLQPQMKAVLQHRPHPFHLLLTPPRGELTRSRKLLAMRQYLLPKLCDAVAGERRVGDDG